MRFYESLRTIPIQTMNIDTNKLAFVEWASAAVKSIPQCPPVTCNLAHSASPQDELLLRTKAEWEKQQAATAAAAMCYWGYPDQNPLFFTKNDWRHLNHTSALIEEDNVDQFLRSGGEHAIKSVKEARISVPIKQEGVPSKTRRQRTPPIVQSVSQDMSESIINKPFPCIDCGKSFRQHSQLLTHQRTHTGDRPYLCTECPKAFRTQGTLSIHRRIHTGEKPYSCEECGRCFRTQGTLVIHRRTHSGARPYKCQDCGKAFAARCSLVVHWRTHTGEKPYMCTECGKLFASRSDSARHTRTHQPGSTAKKTFIRKIIQQHPAL